MDVKYIPTSSPSFGLFCQVRITSADSENDFSDNTVAMLLCYDNNEQFFVLSYRELKQSNFVLPISMITRTLSTV